MRQLSSRFCTVTRLLVSRRPPYLDRSIRWPSAPHAFRPPCAYPPGPHVILALQASSSGWRPQESPRHPPRSGQGMDHRTTRTATRPPSPAAPAPPFGMLARPAGPSIRRTAPRGARGRSALLPPQGHGRRRRAAVPPVASCRHGQVPNTIGSSKPCALADPTGFALPECAAQQPRKALLWPAPRRKA